MTQSKNSFLEQLLTTIDDSFFEFYEFFSDEDTTPEKKEMSDDDYELLEVNKANAKKALKLHDYDRAIEFQTVVFEITEKYEGPLGVTSLENLCKLAQCYFLARQFEESKNRYLQAYRIALVAHGKNHAITVSASESFFKCIDSIRKKHDINQLSSYVYGFMHKTEIEKTSMQPDKSNGDISESITQKRSIANSMLLVGDSYKAEALLRSCVNLQMGKWEELRSESHTSRMVEIIAGNWNARFSIQNTTSVRADYLSYSTIIC
jgi:tetratricopeptide (TPR) repeat protein